MGVHSVVRPKGGSKIIGVSGLAGMNESLFPKILSHLMMGLKVKVHNLSRVKI